MGKIRYQSVRHLTAHFSSIVGVIGMMSGWRNLDTPSVHVTMCDEYNCISIVIVSYSLSHGDPIVGGGGVIRS